MNEKPNIHIFTDGGSRGNPGPAAAGVYIIDDQGTVLYSLGEPLGSNTNNAAEYTAVLRAVQWLTEQPDLDATYAQCQFFLDSELACRQITGVYKIKNEGLRALVVQIWALLKKLPLRYTFTHIPREKNKQADRLVNMALDRNATVTYNNG